MSQCHGTTVLGVRCRHHGVHVRDGYCNLHAPRAVPPPFPNGGGWRGVDLDGTLAFYEEFEGIEHIGPPIPKMRDRVLRWLAQGEQVAIVTARVAPGRSTRTGIEIEIARRAIEQWCLLHLREVIPVTCMKDYGMFELWDDRAIQVIPNTGERADGEAR